MSCCGQKRNETRQQEQRPAAESVYNYTPPRMWDDVQLEYTGKTALTATGSITGKRYRFEHTGSQLVIDYRDAAGMMGIPVLRKVK